MDRKKQNGQENVVAEEATAKKKITVGRILAVVIGVVAIVYFSFSVHVFYNFIRIMIKDPDAAKQPGTAVEALDEVYTEEDE